MKTEENLPESVQDAIEAQDWALAIIYLGASRARDVARKHAPRHVANIDAAQALLIRLLEAERSRK